ncbi:MAG: FmdB family transcriptional regulator [Alphaproteobacteria bacterium HGW-Alphaproteobacteria-10]|jgi:putative FmdB family regulatory protein|nr:MAG: FmdB family transcriptional regulator [Alphaproteobacteria bacterium HGW-Alphaproteobacteria-10]
MPVYEYWCESHGLFTSLRSMASFAEPCDCPDCGALAPRVMFTPPHVAGGDRGRMKAHAINERAADSPKRLSGHGPGCSCCGGTSKKGRATLHRPDGTKSFPSARPWMISH